MRGKTQADLGTPAYGTAVPAHSWLPNQLDGLRNRLGYYGVIDYLPSSTLWAVYGSGQRDVATNDAGWQPEWLEMGENDRLSPWHFTQLRLIFTASSPLASVALSRPSGSVLPLLPASSLLLLHAALAVTSDIPTTITKRCKLIKSLPRRPTENHPGSLT